MWLTLKPCWLAVVVGGRVSLSLSLFSGDVIGDSLLTSLLFPFPSMNSLSLSLNRCNSLPRRLGDSFFSVSRIDGSGGGGGRALPIILIISMASSLCLN